MYRKNTIILVNISLLVIKNGLDILYALLESPIEPIPAKQAMENLERVYRRKKLTSKLTWPYIWRFLI